MSNRTPDGSAKRKARELKERLEERGSLEPQAKPGGRKFIRKEKPVEPAPDRDADD